MIESNQRIALHGMQHIESLSKWMYIIAFHSILRQQMAFHARIKNIGKLADVDIRLDRFTVFAGPNNSGKSFVSKIVYSVLVALRADPAIRHISHLIETLDTGGLRMFDSEIAFSNDAKVESFENQIQELQSFLHDCQSRKNSLNRTTIAQINERLDDMLGRVDEIHNSHEFEYSDEFLEMDEYYILENFRRNLEKVKNEISERNSDSIVSRGRSLELERKFIDNFQVSSVSQLAINKSEPLNIDIDKVGELKYFDKQFDCKLNASASKFLQNFSTVTYLESPIYHKLKRVLEYRRTAFERNRFGQLTGVPGYFYDLADSLKFEFLGEIDFPDLYEKLTSNDVLGGRLAISDDGSISFEENGRVFSLSVTAMGITNLGLLALLVERKVLNKNSFLFIDEPEAHLHPAWQVFLAESLFELARQGVHVVIATHSLEILKWLEVHIKNNPKDKEFVALNQFPMLNQPTLENITPCNFDDKLTQIKEELTQPFFKLYVDGL